MRLILCSPLAVLHLLLIAITLVLLNACGGGAGPQFGDSGGGGGGGGGGTDGGSGSTVNPNFTFTFEGVTDDGRKVVLFLLKAGDLDPPKGSFDAQSTMSLSVVDDFSQTFATPVTGTFDGKSFVLHTEGGSSYSGKFTDADTIELSNDATSTTQIYVRNKNDQFAPRLTATWAYSDDPSHVLQLQPTDPFTDDDVTLIFHGTTFDSTARTVTGYASVSRVLLNVHEQDGTLTRLEGRYVRLVGGSWDPNVIQLDDGRQLTRGGGTPDTKRVLFLSVNTSSNTEQLVSVDLRGATSMVVSGSLDVLRFALSHDGQSVAVIARGQSGASHELYVIELSSGTSTQITQVSTSEGEVFDAAWSPDGQRIGYIAYLSSSAPLGVYLANPTGTQLTNVVSAPTRPASPQYADSYRIAWSASGSQFAFIAAIEGAGSNTGLYSARADGSLVHTLFEAANGGVFSFEWAPAGDTVAFVSNNGSELWTTNVSNAYASNVFAPTFVAEWVNTYKWSGDGTALAYMASEVGTSNVTSFNIASGTYNAISSPAFAPNGVERFVYWRPDNRSVAYLPTAGAGWIVSDGTTTEIVPDPESTTDCGSYLPKLGWSPDGTAVAYWATSTDGCRLTVYEFAIARRTQVSQVIKSWNSGLNVKWLDSKRILFAGDKTDQFKDSLFVAYADGTAALDLLSLPDDPRLAGQDDDDYSLYER